MSDSSDFEIEQAKAKQVDLFFKISEIELRLQKMQSAIYDIKKLLKSIKNEEFEGEF